MTLRRFLPHHSWIMIPRKYLALFKRRSNIALSREGCETCVAILGSHLYSSSISNVSQGFSLIYCISCNVLFIDFYPFVRRILVYKLEETSFDGAVAPINYENLDNQSNYASSFSMPSEASSMNPEGNFQMDHNTLWFIANGLAKYGGSPSPRPYKSRPPQGAPPGPCYNCGEPHWVRDCPHPRKDKLAMLGVPPLTRYCIDCGIK